MEAKVVLMKVEKAVKKNKTKNEVVTPVFLLRMKPAHLYGWHCHQWGIHLNKKAKKWFYKIKKENVYTKIQVMIYWKSFLREGTLAFQTCWSWEYSESSWVLAMGRAKETLGKADWSQVGEEVWR